MPRTRTTRTRTTRQTRANGSIMVKIGRTGSTVQEVLLERGATVADALEAANMDHSSTDRIRVDGDVAGLGTELSNGNVITLAGKISGGR